MDERTDRLLGRAALSLSVLLVVALIATAGRLALLPILDKLGWRALPTAPYTVGDAIDLPEATYRSTPLTVVLFARSSCEACRAALPFHQTLAKLIAGHANARMVLSSPVKDQASGAEVAYAREIGLEAAAVLPWAGHVPRVQAVPTLVLVNNRGVVLGAWQGAGSPADEQRIIDAVRKALGST